MEITVSLIQFDAGVSRQGKNLERARAGVQEASARRSDLALLPELWLDGLDYSSAGRLATPLHEGAFAHMRNLSREARIFLAGSAFERDGEQAFNTLAVFSPEGEMIGHYRKLHLFRPMGEDRFLSTGDRIATVDFPWGRAGLAICYDLRFPELFRHLALAGAGMILLSSQWPYERTGHWRTLTRARAIENQLFFLACNRAGADGEARFAGHSVIYDPWGEMIAEAGGEPVLLTAALDLSLAQKARERIPVFSDRRDDIY